MDQEKLDEVTVTLTYKVKHLNQLLLALGDVPYAKAHGIVAAIHQQAGPQVEEAVKAHMAEAANDPVDPPPPEAA